MRPDISIPHATTRPIHGPEHEGYHRRGMVDLVGGAIPSSDGPCLTNHAHDDNPAPRPYHEPEEPKPGRPSPFCILWVARVYAECFQCVILLLL